MRTAILDALGTAAAVFLLCTHVLAADIEEVIVTGTRVSRAGLDSNRAIAVVSGDEIRAAGTTNLETYIRGLPQAVAADGANANDGSAGAATIDLRNLGPERTLVLIDGKRVVPYDTFGLVDLNTVPAGLIDHVDILTGGASAVYGSDAMAGVVNVILKKSFTGIEGSMQYGASERGDGQYVDISALTGSAFAGGRGNIVLHAGFFDQKSVYQSARAFSKQAVAAADLSPTGSSTTSNGVLITSADMMEFNAAGNLVPQSTYFNFNPYNLLQTPSERWTVTTLGHYDLNDATTYEARFTAARVRNKTVIAPTGTFFLPFDINYATNPYLNAQARQLLADEDTAENGDAAPGDGVVNLAFGRRLSELGAREQRFESTTYQFVNSLKGELGDGYSWQIFFQYGRTARVIDYLNDASIPRVQQALLAVRNGAQIVCTNPANGCAPENLFGASTLSTAAADFIRLNLSEKDTASQMVTGLQLGGDLPWRSPLAQNAGGFAVGLEYRREAGDTKPDSRLASGEALGFGASQPIDARLRVAEAFAETAVPLIQDAPYARSLDLEAGLRYSAYGNAVAGGDNNFSNVTYKIGGAWAPVEALKLRAAYQRAVRAPNLNEIGLPQQFGAGSAEQDPCAGASPVGNAALTALCVATGAPASRIGAIPGPISAEINSFAGGNSALTPEYSRTFTVGAAIHGIVDGFQISADYYAINIDNAIVAPSEQSVLDACYLIIKKAGDPFCRRIRRNPVNGSLISGTDSGVVVTKMNAALYQARGIDISGAYALNVGHFGAIDLHTSVTHVIETTQQNASFLPARDCAGLAGTFCLRPDPKWRIAAAANWRWSDLSTTLSWRHLSSVTNDSVAFGVAAPSDFAMPVIPAYDYFDVTGSYAITERLVARGGVKNLFDRQPPIVGSDYGGTVQNSGNTYPATYDPIGRSYFLGLSVTF